MAFDGRSLVNFCEAVESLRHLVIDLRAIADNMPKPKPKKQKAPATATPNTAPGSDPPPAAAITSGSLFEVQ